MCYEKLYSRSHSPHSRHRGRYLNQKNRILVFQLLALAVDFAKSFFANAQPFLEKITIKVSCLKLVDIWFLLSLISSIISV